jgi:hypothetical protein
MDRSSGTSVREVLVDAGLPQDVVDALLAEYSESKRRYYVGDHVPVAIHGGRFCEAAVRLIQYLGKGYSVPLDEQLQLEPALRQIENDTSIDDSLRLHVPRALRLIYGVRNSRNAGHLRGGLDTSGQDATLVVGVLEWVLAEIVRATHNVSRAVAQALVDGIVTKQVPVIGEFNGKPVLLAKAGNVDHVLALLYWANRKSVSLSELRRWLSGSAARNLRRTLVAAESKHFVFVDGDEVFLTPVGKRHIEQKGLLEAASPVPVVQKVAV